MQLLKPVAQSALGLLLGVLAIWTPGCTGAAPPEEVLAAAQSALADNRVDAFASYLTRESRYVFFLAQSVGYRYGYLDAESFRFVAGLTPGEVVYHDDVAELSVGLKQRGGVLCFVREDGDWKLELLRVSPCLAGSIVSEPALPAFGQPLLQGPSVDFMMPSENTP